MYVWSGCFDCKLSQRMTKPTTRLVRSSKTQIRLRIRAVWSESSLIACAFYSLQTIQRGMNENLPILGGCTGWSLCWSHRFYYRFYRALAHDKIICVDVAVTPARRSMSAKKRRLIASHKTYHSISCFENFRGTAVRHVLRIDHLNLNIYGL